MQDYYLKCQNVLFVPKMLSRNLRGEMIADLEGAKLSLSDSRFIQVIAKSLSISCKEVRSLACSLCILCLSATFRDVRSYDEQQLKEKRY